jgi:FkbM family methyltransferase
MTNGTILESGALNGLKYSTSFMFEKFASWLAIHVEADPKNYNQLRQFRPNSINIHAALCKEAQLLHFTNSPNMAINGFVEFMTPHFIETWHPRLQTNPGLIKSLPSILCVPLPHLLTELGVHKIDVWVLDVEGAELSVLESMDFKKVKVSTIVMECDQRSVEIDQAKQDILKKNGFQCQLVSFGPPPLCSLHLIDSHLLSSSD